MARTTAGPTKTDLQETIDDAVKILENAYTPETAREDLAEAVGKAIDVLNGEDADEDDDDEEEDDDEGE